MIGRLTLGLLLAATIPALAQVEVEAAQQARKRYDDCVWGSITDQIRLGARDPGSISETGFQACLTEENAMRLILGISRINPTQGEAIILKIKLDIKEQLRKIAKDPALYAR